MQKDAELLSKGQENLVSLQGQLVSLKESSQNKERVLVKEVQAKDQALKEAGEKAVLLERERDSLKQRVEGLMVSGFFWYYLAILIQMFYVVLRVYAVLCVQCCVCGAVCAVLCVVLCVCVVLCM